MLGRRILLMMLVNNPGFLCIYSLAIFGALRPDDSDTLKQESMARSEASK